MHFGLSFVDIFIIIAYFLILTLISWVASRRAQKADDFMMAGHGAGRFIIAVSTLACTFSGISYVGISGWVKSNGMVGLLGDSALLVGALCVSIFLIPVFYRRRLTSIYEVLETRFNRGVRLFIAVLFQLARVAWLGGVLYAPALMFQTVTGIHLIYWAVFMGLLGTMVAVSGGLKSIMVADLVQFVIKIGAIIIIIVTAFNLCGGNWSSIWGKAREEHLTNFVVGGFSPFKITTFFYVLGNAIATMASFGADQLGIQRFLSARNLRESRQSVLLFPLITVPFIFLFYLAAMLMIVYFGFHPELLAGFTKPDEVMPQFIKVAIPHGLLGLIIAAVMAASISSFSGGALGLGTVTMEDFLKRFYVGKPPARYLRDSRLVTCCWCVVGILLAFYIWKFENNVLGYILSVGSWVSGVILAIFLLALYSRRVNTGGVVTGMILGTAITTFAAKYNFGNAEHVKQIDLFLYAPIGLVSTLLVAWVTSPVYKMLGYCADEEAKAARFHQPIQPAIERA